MKLILEVEGKDVELSMKDAEELYKELARIFEERVKTQYVPYYSWQRMYPTLTPVTGTILTSATTHPNAQMQAWCPSSGQTSMMWGV